MPHYKDIRKPGFGSLNMDDDPASMEGKGSPQDYTDALNMRIASSDTQHEAGVAETLQGEFEVLIDVEAYLTTYYGEAIGGEFIYTGYEEVQIGNQVWMRKNWDADYPGNKAYDDDEDNVDEYGRLYTHGMVMASDFCPDGYRVPTEADLDALLTFLGGALIAGGAMKELWTSHWQSPNTGATNSSGFKGLPGGMYDIAYDLLQEMGLFWLQDEAEPLAPVGVEATGITFELFFANWLAAEGATGYKLDVATDEDFTSFVAGHEDLDVGNVLTYEVVGLAAETSYYYRVRAYNEIGTSENSETIETLTSPTPSSILLIGTGPSALILRSVDNGETFVNMGSEGNGNPLCFVKLTNGETLYGTDTGYVINHDTGLNVSVSAFPIITIDQDEVIAGRIFIGDENGDLYLSDNNGVTWFASGINHGRANVIDVWGGAGNWTLFSADGIYVNNILRQAGNFLSAVQNGRYFAGDDNGHIWYSDDGELTWNDFGLKTSGEGDGVIFMFITEAGRIFFASESGYVYYTDDNDFTIVHESDFVSGGTLHCIVEGDGVLLTGWDNGTIRKSSDNGVTWPDIIDINSLFGEDDVYYSIDIA